MMGRLYSFSHNKAKLFRMSFEKVNQSKKILEKAKYICKIYNIYIYIYIHIYIYIYVYRQIDRWRDK